MRMNGIVVGASVASLLAGMGAGLLLAQQQAQPPARQPFFVGNPLGLPMVPAADGVFKPMSSNVKVYGAIYNVHACAYDPVRNLIVVFNRGVANDVEVNNAWISFLNHDGSVHTARWLGVQNPGTPRANLDPPLVLNEPLGNVIVNGKLYVSDSDGGTPDPANPGQLTHTVAVIRMFDMKSGTPLGEIRVPAATEKDAGSPGLNDIGVAADGTIYGTQTNDARIFKITADGRSSIFLEGAPLNRPNGIAIDAKGSIVVNNSGDDLVLTYAPDGKLLLTEHAAQPGSDGLILMPDGTKYVSSVRNGGISRMRPGRPAELIAENIPSAADMCYDPVANQLVIPMNPNNALAFLKLN